MSSRYIYKWFKPSEFKKCVPPCDIEAFSYSFLATVDCLRDRCGFPLIPTSGYRSVQYEKEHGRSGASFHCAGRAIDVRCRSGLERAVIVRNALELGLSVGVYSTFIHLDDRPEQILFYGK